MSDARIDKILNRELGNSENSGRGGMMLIDPNSAIKAAGISGFSSNAIEFLMSSSASLGDNYNNGQLLTAYMSSVYLYAGLNRIANLISRAKVVAEVKQGGSWVRLPETHILNTILERDMQHVFPRAWLNYAIYGSSVIYKVKSRRAVLAEERGTPIYRFDEGAVSGLLVLDKPQWEIVEGATYGEIDGITVNRTSNEDNVIVKNGRLSRDEFIYFTSWNPANPSRGKSIVSICMHEAVANASIAAWMSEYFTRGAMPFLLVSMAEEDPTMLTDADLRKYKRQFEKEWQGLSASLRAAVLDRRVQVDQVGISANEVAAPELNEAALEGIAAALGLDRELIVTPQGGSYDRHELLIKRAWVDTIIPVAEKIVSAMQRDLGLPEDMRLVVDVSDISELDAGRDDRINTELDVYRETLQSFNEVRVRLNMPPIPELDGWYYYGDKLVPLDHIMWAGEVPPQEIVDYATQLWNDNLAKKSEVLALLRRKLPEGERDGYRDELEGFEDKITSFWGDDLMTRGQVLAELGIPQPPHMVDGYRSEIEAAADQNDFITGTLWSDNLLKRSEVLKLLGFDPPPDMIDGYRDQVSTIEDSIASVIGDARAAEIQAKIDAQSQETQETESSAAETSSSGGASASQPAAEPIEFEEEEVEEVAEEQLASPSPETPTNTEAQSPELIDEEAAMSAEEDFLEDFGIYSYDPLRLPDSWGENVDYMPSEALPQADVPDDYGVRAENVSGGINKGVENTAPQELYIGVFVDISKSDFWDAMSRISSDVSDIQPQRLSFLPLVKMVRYSVEDVLFVRNSVARFLPFIAFVKSFEKQVIDGKPRLVAKLEYSDAMRIIHNNLLIHCYARGIVIDKNYTIDKIEPQIVVGDILREDINIDMDAVNDVGVVTGWGVRKEFSDPRPFYIYDKEIGDIRALWEGAFEEYIKSGDLNNLPPHIASTVAKSFEKIGAHEKAKIKAAIADGFFDRGDAKVIRISKQNDAIGELRAWRRSFKNNPKKALGFDVFYVPDDLSQEIRSAIEKHLSGETDKNHVFNVFSNAKKKIINN